MVLHGKTLPAEHQKLKPTGESTQTGTQKSTQTENPDLNPISENIAGGVGFEPTTTDLGGRCSIRTELREKAIRLPLLARVSRPWFLPEDTMLQSLQNILGF